MGKIKTVPINTDFEQILISAERYAIGRASYLPPDTIQYIRVLLPYLSKRCLVVMSRDIEEEFERYKRIDRTIEYASLWQKLLEEINDEIVMTKLPFTED